MSDFHPASAVDGIASDPSDRIAVSEFACVSDPVQEVFVISLRAEFQEHPAHPRDERCAADAG